MDKDDIDEDYNHEDYIDEDVQQDKRVELGGSYDEIAFAFLIRNLARHIHYWRGDFLVWNQRHYEVIPDLEIEAALSRFMNNAVQIKEDKNGNKQRVKFSSSTKLVNEVIAQIKWSPNVLIPQSQELFTRIADGLPLPRLIPCRNGLLDLETEQMYAHNPEYLVLHTLAFDYKSDMSEPTEWLKFLCSIWPDDDGTEGGHIACLQELMGYVLSGEQDLQKIFLLIGPARCGKGTITHVLTMLNGDAYTVGVNLDAFGRSFGMMGLIGKTLCVLPDQRNSHRANFTGTLTERLLTLSGCDKVSVERKYKDDWTGVLPARAMILTNEVPHIPDSSGVIATRFVPIVFDISFLNREDKTLWGKLEPELPQIMKWSIEGLKRLRQRGRFVLTGRAEEMLASISRAAAPHLEFLRDSIVQDLDGICPKHILYEKYVEWCKGHGHVPCADNIFSNRLKMAYPNVEDTQVRIDGKRPHVWRGIRLADDPEANHQHYPDVAMALRAQITKAKVMRASGRPISPEDEAIIAQVDTILGNMT